ncbi:MAG TPA: SRPBCC family protein, partial [Steroidobacteraceae bacterium]
WGPESLTCIDAQIDLRVGGRYRIGNQFPDGKVLWITGEFEIIDAPHRLVYTWELEPVTGAPERVTVQFAPQGDVTEVIVTHEGIASEPLRDRHLHGWHGCLDGLVNYLQPAP